jgi:hypothetical protein
MGQALPHNTDIASFETHRPDEYVESNTDFSDIPELLKDVEDVTEPVTTLEFPDPNKPEPLANRLLWLLLQNPTLLNEPLQVPKRSRLINIQALSQVAEWILITDKPTTASLMGHCSGTELGRLLSKLLSREKLFSESSYQAEFTDGIEQLKKQLVTESMRHLAEDAKRGKISAEDLHQALTAHKK